jgi:uncharacterized protein (DUF362 family)
MKILKTMDAFVNIRTVYNTPNQRSIAYLSEIYRDYENLIKIIREITKDYLTSEKINGKKVLLKPNWVLHNNTKNDELCLRTHENFVLAALEIILEKHPSQIILGDAPVQGCNWNKMITPNFTGEIEKLSKKYGIEILIKDFRRVSYDQSTNQLIKDRNSLENYILFDVGEKSYLEAICDDNRNLFRVTNYNPDRLAETHRKGVHKYCIIKDLFDSDVVITLPKIKTHQKAGLTNALKILVGINGDKDFLPHHRKGGTDSGGDCYPGKNLLRNLSEKILDHANHHIGEKSYKTLLHLSAAIWKISLPKSEHNTAAAWYGNDTTWRMVLDINTIALYGKKNGTLSGTPQREMFSLCDGIIGGQGDGPLHPIPLALGIVAFSNNAALMDLAAGHLMEMKVTKIPLLMNALKWIENIPCQILFNNEKVTIEELARHSIKAEMPPGWINYDK